MDESASAPAGGARFQAASQLCLERQTSLDMNVREEVIANFMQVARDHGRRLAQLSDDLALIDTGLDSLGFAIVVTRLEQALGVDPFTANGFANFPRTFGGFIGCYETAVRLPVS